MKKRIFLFLLLIFAHQISLKNVYAVRYSLIAPSGTLSRGQTVTFTINIDTQGQNITNAQIGMTYETQYLEYINTISSDTFPNLTTTPQEGGKLIFQASSSSGFNGSGTFAQVNFKIIADAPGSSQLCVLWEVPQGTITQTPSPTSPGQPSPTQIPTSGQDNPFFIGLTLASLLVLGASAGIIFYKKLSFQPKLVKKISSRESKNKLIRQQESTKRK